MGQPETAALEVSQLRKVLQGVAQVEPTKAGLSQAESQTPPAGQPGQAEPTGPRGPDPLAGVLLIEPGAQGGPAHAQRGSHQHTCGEGAVRFNQIKAKTAIQGEKL